MTNYPTTNEQLVISNDAGLKVGQGATITFDVLRHVREYYLNLTSSSIDFKVNNLGTQANVIRIDLTERVGINTLSTAEALDVAGFQYKQVII